MNKKDGYIALVMSDLHLGAGNCIFMNSKDTFNDTIAEKIIKRIRKETQQKGKFKYLVLAGDVLELSLAERRKAYELFRAFLVRFKDLFECLLYIPGNHDHHVWVALQEECHVNKKICSGTDIERYRHSFTPTINAQGALFPDNDNSYGSDTFLNRILPKDKELIVAYPNVYFDLYPHQIVITHGHFFEDLWTLSTDAFHTSLGIADSAGITYEQLERINSPFTEFGWYSIGQAGELNTLLRKMTSEIKVGRHETIHEMADELNKYMDEKIYFDADVRKRRDIKSLLYNRVGRHAMEAYSDAVLFAWFAILKKFFAWNIADTNFPFSQSALRNNAAIFDSAKKRADIQRYLEIAFHECSFKPNALMFGHTHVPFKKTCGSNCYLIANSLSVESYNMGCWIADVDGNSAETLEKTRPAIGAVKYDGRIEHIEIPWPDRSAFEKVLKQSVAVKDVIECGL
ncbi:MAG: metallophosphoesterase [Chitinispirillaceae bacterium]|nr:metallophosphoesterase [Chitinispirillaceae bacterium]